MFFAQINNIEPYAQPDGHVSCFVDFARREGRWPAAAAVSDFTRCFADRARRFSRRRHCTSFTATRVRSVLLLDFSARPMCDDENSADYHGLDLLSSFPVHYQCSVCWWNEYRSRLPRHPSSWYFDVYRITCKMSLLVVYISIIIVIALLLKKKRVTYFFFFFLLGTWRVLVDRCTTV